jgi:thiol-disulfide isomerase/thioredoxin
MSAVQSRRISVFLAYACLVIAPSNANTPLDLNEFRGRVIYLDFWASWCKPCRQSFPWMDELQRKYRNRGLLVVAVNVDQDRGQADQFLNRFGPSFRILFDPSGELAEKFKVPGMPSSFLIDRRGVVRERHVGFLPENEESIDSEVQELIAEQ